MYPAAVQLLVSLSAVTHMSDALAEDTSVAAVRRTSKIAARARDAREMYSVSRVSFGAELGRPPMCLRLNKLHSVVRRLPSSLVGGVAQAFHDDQVVELRVQLAVQEVEGKEEDREGQVEVEEEKRLKEVRSWMTMEMFMTRLRS